MVDGPLRAGKSTLAFSLASTLHRMGREVEVLDGDGCTHLMGRDNAGVGSYYGSYDAPEIFDCLAPGDLDLKILSGSVVGFPYVP
jgi:cellulose biosynthesis protein BcsQ